MDGLDATSNFHEENPMSSELPPKLVTAAEFCASYQPPEQVVRLDADGDIELKAVEGGYWYCIERDRIDTEAKLIRWLLHLSTTKTWFSREHTRQLIEQFVEITGFRPHGL
jgi:hypothetical protein